MYPPTLLSAHRLQQAVGYRLFPGVKDFQAFRDEIDLKEAMKAMFQADLCEQTKYSISTVSCSLTYERMSLFLIHGVTIQLKGDMSDWERDDTKGFGTHHGRWRTSLEYPISGRTCSLSTFDRTFHIPIILSRRWLINIKILSLVKEYMWIDTYELHFFHRIGVSKEFNCHFLYPEPRRFANFERCASLGVRLDIIQLTLRHLCICWQDLGYLFNGQNEFLRCCKVVFAIVVNELSDC